MFDVRFTMHACAYSLGMPHERQDIFAVPNGVQSIFRGGCEFVNINIAGRQGGCILDDIIDIFDIAAVLDAFQGLRRCCSEPR